MEEKDSVNKDSARNMPYTGQLNKCQYAESMDTSRQREKRARDVCKCNNQTPNLEF